MIDLDLAGLMIYIAQVICWVYFFVVAINLTYRFQLCEYRFDRFRAYIKEFGLGRLFFPRTVRAPAKTARNFLIVLGFIVLMLISMPSLTAIFSLFIVPWGAEKYQYLEPMEYLYLAGYFVVGLLIEFVGSVGGVLLMVLITWPLSKYKARREVEKAKQKISQSKAVFIGVTGSYGKTSVKDFLHYLLSAKFKTEKTQENYNTYVGVALSINERLKDDTEYFVTEIGSYKEGEIKSVTDYVHPKIGVLTALGNQHLDLFGSRENLIAAKKELMDSLPADGVAYVNMDTPDYEKATEGIGCKVVLYSAGNDEADIFAKDIRWNGKGYSFKVVYKGEEIDVRSGLIAEHDILNLLPAIAIAMDVGIEIKHISERLKGLQNKSNRLKVWNGKFGAVYLDDSYSSSENGFVSAAKTLEKITDGKCYALSKGIIELGADKTRAYKKILKVLREYGVVLITTDKIFKKVADKTTEDFDIILMQDENEMFKYLKENVNKGDGILIEGRFDPDFVKRLELKEAK